MNCIWQEQAQAIKQELLCPMIVDAFSWHPGPEGVQPKITKEVMREISNPEQTIKNTGMWHSAQLVTAGQMADCNHLTEVLQSELVLPLICPKTYCLLL